LWFAKTLRDSSSGPHVTLLHQITRQNLASLARLDVADFKGSPARSSFGERQGCVRTDDVFGEHTLGFSATRKKAFLTMRAKSRLLRQSLQFLQTPENPESRLWIGWLVGHSIDVLRPSIRKIGAVVIARIADHNLRIFIKPVVPQIVSLPVGVSNAGKMSRFVHHGPRALFVSSSEESRTEDDGHAVAHDEGGAKRTPGIGEMRSVDGSGGRRDAIFHVAQHVGDIV
jgi:hypothetical protein